MCPFEMRRNCEIKILIFEEKQQYLYLYYINIYIFSDALYYLFYGLELMLLSSLMRI